MSRSRSRDAARTALRLLGDVARFASSALRSHAQLAAENLFLRKQLALYIERQVKPCRADDATRIALVTLARLFEWRRVLTIVKPDTLIRWHRKGFQLFWAMEIATAGPAASAGRRATTHRRHGGGESHVGRRADRL